jgi:Protein of unknown function (DUF3307)
MVMLEQAVTFAVVLPTLLVAHHVADHWIQTDEQAKAKGQRGVEGRNACAVHVCTYTLTTILFVSTMWLLFSLPISSAGFLLGQAVSAVTHYWADRKFTLEWLTQQWPFSRMGKHDFYRSGRVRVTAAWSGDDGSHVQLYQAGRDDPVSWDNPSLGTGAYALDQSWHKCWLFVAALVTSLV